MNRKEYVKAEYYPLKEYNSMRIDAVAESIYMPFSPKGIEQVFQECENDHCIILGEGSNTILSSNFCQKPIITASLMKMIQYDDTGIIAQSGATLSELAWFALEHSLQGFEYLEDIPGSIGGALCMNAGTYDDYIASKVHSVTIYDYIGQKIEELGKDQLFPFWGKRDSYFQHHPCFIIQCVLEASAKGEYEKILDRMLEIKRRRYMKQPRDYPSAGSVFKRPYVNGEPVFVWKLLDEAGLRGYRIGDAQVSLKHPGFIVNVGHATGNDVIGVMNYCKKEVFERFGVMLEEEWKIV